MLDVRCPPTTSPPAVLRPAIGPCWRDDPAFPDQPRDPHRGRLPAGSSRQGATGLHPACLPARGAPLVHALSVSSLTTATYTRPSGMTPAWATRTSFVPSTSPASRPRGRSGAICWVRRDGLREIFRNRSTPVHLRRADTSQTTSTCARTSTTTTDRAARPPAWTTNSLNHATTPR